MTTIYWSVVVQKFSECYDEVFESTGRKAYFDFHKDLSTHRFIDGGKRAWKLPFLMDAVACAFYGIQPNSYRRKTRKFNQHHILDKILKSLLGSEREAPLNLVIDRPEWTTFENLRKELTRNNSKKNISKYEEIVTMYLYDEAMNNMGLPIVIERVVQLCIENMSQNGTSQHQHQPIARQLSANSSSMSSIDSDGGEQSHVSGLPSKIPFLQQPLSSSSSASEPLPQQQTQSLIQKLSSSSINKPKVLPSMTTLTTESMGLFLLAFHQKHSFDFKSTTSNSNSGNSNSTEMIKFAVRSKDGTALRHLFTEDNMIAFAAAASENVFISLVEKITETEWVYEADLVNSEKILNRGGFRAFGLDLCVCPHLPAL